MPSAADNALAPENLLTWRLHRLGKLTEKDTGDALADALDLPHGEARCLAAVGRFAPLSVVELARHANLHKGPASRAAQSLSERGLVRKAACRDDARGVVLTLTGAGRRTWSRVVRVLAQRNEDVFGCLSAAERRQLGALVDRLIANSQSAR
ncbi:MarR family winged helix-turn-helix transcriptional regulator [Ramlibacter sp. MAHUQ-53]|uniref:MarR family winged helix-turn-helix transcriptional regulator n=1 Tax=unclassified Ramlibacter TaxID=2617605 RepID=UPI00363AC106